MPIYNKILALFWLVFLVVWLVSAFAAKRTLQNGYGKKTVLIRLIATVIIVGIVWFLKNHGVSPRLYVRTVNPTVGSIGVVLVGIGIALAIWARFYLGRNWGMPMSIKENAELVTSGPYTYVRHPIYTGVMLALLGTSFVVGFWLLFILVVYMLYFYFSAKHEEETLLERFPNQFPDYKKRTKMLIPFVF